MWKLLIGITALLCLSFCLGWMIQQDPGYVLISYNHWSIETSLWFALAAIFILSLTIYWGYKLLKHGIFLPTHIANWSLSRKQRVAGLETAYGLCELLEAHWDKAEQKLIKSTKYVANPFVNYLGAAFAAQQKKSFSERDEYLQKAQAVVPGSQTAIALLKAHFQMDSDQDILAFHGVQNLLNQSPKHPATLNLARKLYKQLGEWPALLHLLPAIGKYSKLHEDELKHLNITTYAELLKQAVATQDAVLVEQAWLAIPKDWKSQSEILASYVEFHAQNPSDTMLKLLEECIKKNWNEELVRLYGLCISKSPAKQLKLAETWLKQNSHSAVLLICLGRLSAREQLWGKAQDYFSASISIDPKASTYLELAKIQEQLKRLDAAQESYRKGLAMLAAQETLG